MIWLRFVKIGFRIYALLWLTAVGGFLGANAAGAIFSLVSALDGKPATTAAWMQAGWWLGTVLFAFGAITGRRKFINGASSRQSDQAKDEDETASIGKSESAAATQAIASEETDDRKFMKSGIVSSAAGFGLVGGLAGAIIGGSFLMFWFSFAYSPFAGSSIVESIELVRDSSSSNEASRTRTGTSHPVALYLVLLPGLIGLTAGIILGAIGAAAGKVYHPE